MIACVRVSEKRIRNSVQANSWTGAQSPACNRKIEKQLFVTKDKQENNDCQVFDTKKEDPPEF
jgi:hypothetical protein